MVCRVAQLSAQTLEFVLFPFEVFFSIFQLLLERLKPIFEFLNFSPALLLLRPQLPQQFYLLVMIDFDAELAADPLAVVVLELRLAPWIVQVLVCDHLCVRVDRFRLEVAAPLASPQHSSAFTELIFWAELPPRSQVDAFQIGDGLHLSRICHVRRYLLRVSVSLCLCCLCVSVVSVVSVALVVSVSLLPLLSLLSLVSLLSLCLCVFVVSVSLCPCVSVSPLSLVSLLSLLCLLPLCLCRLRVRVFSVVSAKSQLNRFAY